MIGWLKSTIKACNIYQINKGSKALPWTVASSIASVGKAPQSEEGPKGSG